MRWRPRRYTLGARFYDKLAAEWVYRPGRVVAIEQLRLRPGDQVLDIGCGTGLNFALLLERVGPDGLVVGVDASRQMLAQARHRAQGHGWSNITLLHADATAIDHERLSTCFARNGADAVLSTYALSLMDDWRRAWDTARRVARPGARMAVVDMRMPSGTARLLTPIARLACALGGADPNAGPWSAVDEDCVDVVAASLRGGHIQVRVGTVTDQAARRPSSRVDRSTGSTATC